MDETINKIYASLGLVIGLVFVYISLDLLTNGRLTGLWSPTIQEVSE
jgi:hypothetical protein